MSNPGETLGEALKARGLRHRPGKVHGKREIYEAETGRVLGDFNAREGWTLIADMRIDDSFEIVREIERINHG